MKITMSSSRALAKNRSRLSEGSVSSRPATFGLISTPRRPSCLTQRSSSATASSTFCSGTVPRATKRSGQVATICASRTASWPSAGLGPVVGLLRRGAHRLDVDAHPVHVRDAHLDRGELGRPVVHLLDVDLAGELARELHRRLVLRRIQMRELGR